VFARKRSLIITLSVGILLIFTAIIVPHLRNSLIDSLSWSLQFFSHISQEIQGIIFYHNNLIQNQKFKKELGLLKRELYEIEELYFENARLRELLDFKEKSIYPLTAATVIGYDPLNLSSVIVIDKGRREGVRKGCAVITNDGLLGRVVESGLMTSKVLLINDSNSGVAALIQRNRQQGLVSGTLSGRLILHYLPPDADIQVSDLVITSGLGGLYPKGIMIGRISEIQDQASAGSILAIVETSANLTRLEEVLVVLLE